MKLYRYTGEFIANEYDKIDGMACAYVPLGNPDKRCKATAVYNRCVSELAAMYIDEDGITRRQAKKLRDGSVVIKDGLLGHGYGGMHSLTYKDGKAVQKNGPHMYCRTHAKLVRKLQEEDAETTYMTNEEAQERWTQKDIDEINIGPSLNREQGENEKAFEELTGLRALRYTDKEYEAQKAEYKNIEFLKVLGDDPDWEMPRDEDKRKEYINKAQNIIQMSVLKNPLFDRYVKNKISRLGKSGNKEIDDDLNEKIERAINKDGKIDFDKIQLFTPQYKRNAPNRGVEDAQAERLIAQFAFAANAQGFINSSGDVSGDTGDADEMIAQQYSLRTSVDLRDAAVYYWTDEIFNFANEMPLPPHNITVLPLQHPNGMFFSFQSAYQMNLEWKSGELEKPPISEENNIYDQLLQDPLPFLTDPQTHRHVGDRNWIYIREAFDKDKNSVMEIFHDFGLREEYYDRNVTQDSRIFRDVIKQGDHFPTDFAEPEYIELVLSLLNFLNTPLVHLERRGLPRSTRKQLERETGEDKGTWSAPKFESNVIILRHPQRRVERDEDGEPLYHTFRWWNSGHFRNQWYPSLGIHKLKWIDAYIKGPEGKPLKRKTYRVEQ